MLITQANPEDEYAKYKELRKEDVEALQQWMAKQPHLPTVTDLHVIQFFQSCYFKMEPTKTTIETYFTLKTCWPELFLDRDPNFEQLKQAADASLITVLPKPTPEGYVVILATLMDYDPAKFSFLPYIKLFDSIGMLWLAENGTAEGTVLVLDMNHTTLSHLSTFTITGLKNLFCYLQEALPTRLKGMHYVNAGAVMDKLMVLMKPFIKKQLLEILHVHAKIGENFYRHVPQELLPADYGGSGAPLTDLHAAMKKSLLGNADYLIEAEKFASDESKRVGKRNDPTHGYGADGSFKKLDID